MSGYEEELPEGFTGLLDKKLNEILAKIGIGEGKDDIIEQCGSIRIRVFEAGEYERKDKPGEMVKFPAGIELRQGGLVLRCEASDLATLKLKMTKVPELRTVLQKRLDEEKQLMDEMGF